MPRETNLPNIKAALIAALDHATFYRNECERLAAELVEVCALITKQTTPSEVCTGD